MRIEQRRKARNGAEEETNGPRLKRREPKTLSAHTQSSILDPQSSLTAKLAKLGITRDFDFVLHLPLRYEDETRITRIADASSGPVQVEGVVVKSSIQYRPRRQLVCQIADESGVLFLRFFTFYMSQAKALSAGSRVRAFGEVRGGFFGAEMVHPRYKTLRSESPLPQSLTPIYPASAGISQANLRKWIAEVLDRLDLSDTLPTKTLSGLRLAEFEASVRLLHHPPPDAPSNALEQRSHPAWRRIKFDELLAQQLSMRLAHLKRRGRGAPALKPKHDLTRALISSLPFKLTRAQLKVWSEISHDLGQPHPMQRLLQGDVGSGKTIIAALAAAQALENGVQAAIMAPTEILAEQHYRKFSTWLGPLKVKIAWLTGGLKKSEKQKSLKSASKGDIDIVIGTHALFQEQVAFRALGLAIIDEQHRFGVGQRLALREKGQSPHQLMMSATPIPRTLAMSYYADLDISLIDELPPGRAPVETRLIAASRRKEVLRRVRDACLAGGQAYWICPLIEESETLQLQTALATYQDLCEVFPEIETGLIHGRLETSEKAETMAAFARGHIQLLVATTVIEVGVDVPNATLMVIENAERMGLAQLHQLRGRVGRGERTSVCVLMYQSPLSESARERLKIIYKNSDGFEIAKHDLRLRGPGELLGARQSGVPLLRFADLTRDQDLLEQARDAAQQLLAHHPAAAKRHLERWIGAKRGFLHV
ncbi:MAG: ATP-dependent DNA helicase RecG [Burkholderiales bacterium]